MFTRRNFLKTATAASLAGLLIPKQIFASMVSDKIGIQLYSLHQWVNNDLEGVLDKLYEIGYRSIEAAGYQEGQFYGLNPQTFHQIIQDHGLEAVSSHSYFTLEKAKSVIEDANKAGIKFIVFPSIPSERRGSIDDYKRVADELNEIGQLCRKENLYFGYHNHAFEFISINGMLPYDTLIEHTDPNLVFFQLDTYWMVYGGQMPESYFQKYPGRFKLLHLKDMAIDNKEITTAVGQGSINFEAIFEGLNAAGTMHLLVEQEHYENEANPYPDIANSLQYIKKNY